MNRHKRLIVNADDFGLHNSINSAIVKAHLHGIVTSTSLMAIENCASFSDAVRLSQEFPSLDIGLHFALVGLPSLPPDYLPFGAAALKGAFPSSRIENLLNRQLDFLERHGIHPSHIDSHQHLHAMPKIMRVVCKVAAERKIMAIRLPLEYVPRKTALNRMIASRTLALFSIAAKKQIKNLGLWYPDHFLGMAISGHLTEVKLLDLLDDVQDGVTEIVCHPGSDNGILARQYDWAYDWEGELSALTSETVRQKIAERQIELTSFRLF